MHLCKALDLHTKYGIVQPIHIILLTTEKSMFNKSENPNENKKSMFREYAEALIIALCLALFIRTFVVQAFKIPSESMLQTLLVGDHLLVSKFSYGVKIPFTQAYIFEGDDPQYGDVVVFKYPKDPSLDYIKRVVGRPGDVIEMRDKQLFRNGEAIKEAYARNSDPHGIYPTRDNFGPFTVPEGEYFMLGDNRDNSQDSRYWGTVKKAAMHGKAWRIYWSANGLDNIRLQRFGKAVE